MKKPMFKRAGALALTAMMAMSLMAGSAFAADIQVGQDASTDTFSAYRLLDLTTSLKGDCGHGEGDTHENSCYNYSYTVAEKYRAVLQAQDAIADSDSDGVKTDKEILSSIQNMASNSDELRAFADSVYAAIKESHITADADSAGDNRFEGVSQGYYLIAQNSHGEGAAESLVMLDTAGQQDIVVALKSSIPTLTKTISDGGDFVEGVTVAYGDKVTYGLGITIPANMKEFANLKLTVKDTLPAGVTMVADSVALANAGSVGSVVDLPAVSVTGEGQEKTMVIDFGKASDHLKALAADEDYYSLRLTYQATVNSDDTVVLGSTGNANRATLTFTADPYDANDEATTQPDTAKFYSFGLVINKVTDATPNNMEDNVTKPLAGAEFKLEKQVVNGTETSWVEVSAPTVNENGDTFTFNGLDVGKYKITETKTPDGYAAIDPIEFTVNATVDVNGALTVLETNRSDITVSTEDGTMTTAIMNVTGNRMPITGGAGVYALYIGGAVLLFAAGAVIILKKKHSSAE